MQNVAKKSTKSIQQYRHNIKLLKYHLKKEQKINQTLRYKDSKKNKKESIIKHNKIQQKNSIYSMLEVVNTLNQKLKAMGLSLGDIFRMADYQYDGEVTKEQFMSTVSKLKANLQQTQINQMFYAIDSNLNGMLSSDQYTQFLFAHGGSESKQAFKFQKESSQKLMAVLKKKNIKSEQFIKNLLNPVPIEVMNNQLKKLNLNVNQIMILLKLWDPSLSGYIKHQVYLKSMQNVKQKDERQIQNQKYQKGIKQLCVIFRDRKINPVEIYELSDQDGKQGVSILQLEEGFKKLMPEETTYQIKKWVSLININNDYEIAKEEFVSAIRSFYSLQQINNFSGEYEKIHPKLKKALEEEDLPAEKIINQLSIIIQDNGYTKAQVFHRIDINHNGLIDKAELLEGLKNLGIHIGFIGKVLAVFDRDASGEVGLDQWLSILGQDLQMQQVSVPQETSKISKPEKKLVKPVAKDVKKQKQKDVKKQTSNSPIKQTKNKQESKPKQIKKEVITKVQVIVKDKKKKIEQQPIKASKKIGQSKKNNVQQKKTAQPKKNSEVKKSTQPKKNIQPKKVQKQQQKKPLNQTKNNQIIKKTQAAEKKSKKQPQPFQQFADQQSNNFDDLKQTFSQEDISTQDVEKQIGQKYSKSKKKTLQLFQKCSKNKKKGLSEKQLGKFIAEMNLTAECEEKKLKKIFEDNCSTNGLITTQWFDKLMETYELIPKAQSDREEEVKSRKKKQEQPSNLPQIDKRALQSKFQPPQNSQNEEGGYNEQFQNNQSGAISNRQENQNNDFQQAKEQPRGINHQNFQELINLAIQNQTLSDEGYKLKNFISCPEQIQLLQSKYKKQANSVKKNKKIFEDKSFPTKLSSLTHLTPSDSQISDVSLLKWKHYKEIYRNPQLFKNSITPNDIRQGSLGDCYFLCSLAALAEYKNLIERLFQYFDNENGYFLVWVCIDGGWRLIELDGFIPVIPSGDKPAFSHGDQEELWVMLLQKAYAKAYGNYEKIIGGQPYQAIKDLTGSPGQSFSHTKAEIKQDDIWKKLDYANKQQFIMTCGTDVDNEGNIKMDGHSQSVTNQGLVLGHAYSILDVRQYKKERLIQLRNPWGQTQWKGDWSDQSAKWTKQAKKQLGYNSLGQDGIFWMPFQIYFEKYNTTAINYIRPNYFYSSQLRKSTKSLIIKISQSSFNHGFIMATQGDHRKDGLPPNTPYNVNHMIALQYKKGKISRQVSNEKYLYQRQGSIEVSSSSGSQIVILINLQKKTDINLCTYTDNKFAYQVDEQSENMMRYIEDMATMEDRAKNVQQTPNMFKTWMSSVGEYAFLVFKSVAKKQIGFQVELNGPKNIELIPKNNKVDIKVKPGETKCVKGRILDLKDKYSFGALQFSMDA